MRRDYDRFGQRGAEILVVGPDGPNAFRRYWQENDMPFPGLADLRSRVAERYYQEFNMLKLGRMPAVFVLDGEGIVRYSHYGDSMSDIPRNDDLLEIIDRLLKEQAVG